MAQEHPPEAASRYVHEEQHGPEMDDTQAEATGELADRFDPVEPGEPDEQAPARDEQNPS